MARTAAGEMTRPLLAFSGWPHLAFAARHGAVSAVWFCFVYFGANWITTLHERRVRLHLDWELGIPFFPAFVVPYMSIYALFALAPFILRERAELLSLTRAVNVIIGVAGAVFLLIPAQLAWPAPNEAELGPWKQLFNFADWINLDYNLAPSLHVALSVICAEAYRSNAMRVWAALIALSTVFLHQHHLADVALGYALALAVGRRFLFDARRDSF